MDVAKQIVHTSLSLTDKDVVRVSASPQTLDVAVRIAQEVERVGAQLLFAFENDDLALTEFTEVADQYRERESAIERQLAEVLTAEISLNNLENPDLFDRLSPERMNVGASANEAIRKRRKERAVRFVGVGLSAVTPQRARRYGVDYERWKRIETAAMEADLEAIRGKGQRVAKLLDGASSIRIKGSGTDLAMSFAGRSALVEDGIIDANDIARGATYTTLPTGYAAMAPVEESVNGRVTFDPFPLWGRWVRGMTWEFRDGTLISEKATENGELFKRLWDGALGAKDRFGFIQIGLNPKAEYLGAFVDAFVPGAVSVFLGENEDLGGKNPGPYYFGATVRGTTVVANGSEVVRDGALRA